LGWLIGGALFSLMGASTELSLGSFKHWFDWGWPRRVDRLGTIYAKVICGRILLVIGISCLVVAVVSFATV
jgi:hypothetical protein